VILGFVFSGWFWLEVLGEQIGDVCVLDARGHIGEGMAQPCVGVDATGAAGEHETADDGAGPCAGAGVAEEPAFSAGGEDPDVAFEDVVVDGPGAVVQVARQVFPLVQGIGDGVSGEAVRRDLGLVAGEPVVECGQSA